MNNCLGFEYNKIDIFKFLVEKSMIYLYLKSIVYLTKKKTQ